MLYHSLPQADTDIDTDTGTNTNHRRTARFSIRISIKYLPVHYPTDVEKKDPSLYADNVREEMAEDLG